MEIKLAEADSDKEVFFFFENKIKNKFSCIV